MNRLYVLIFCLSCFDSVSAQIQVKLYTWDEIQNASPDTIYGIDLSGSKLERLPDDLQKFTHLKDLDLSKNKLTKLPEFIELFKEIETLDISRNRFAVFPIVITRLTNLTNLKANRNEFDRLPDAIRYNSLLQNIDLWDTPVSIFPEGFFTLAQLKKVDLSGIRYGPTFQKSLTERMPWVDFILDEPCDCMD